MLNLRYYFSYSCVKFLINLIVVPKKFHKLFIVKLKLGIFTFQAGIIEEMMEDTFESMEDGEEMEEAAEEEVDRILFDITAGDKNKITAQSHIFVFVCFGGFFREFKSEPQISYKVKTLKTLVLLSLVRCPWQSTEQSHRCPA